jgi:hypothetical protein
MEKAASSEVPPFGQIGLRLKLAILRAEHTDCIPLSPDV